MISSKGFRFATIIYPPYRKDGGAERDDTACVSFHYPTNWSAANVSTVGITDGNHRIDQDKLQDFNSWGYEERRGYLHTTKDYYFFLEYLNGTMFNELCKDPGAGCAEWNTSYHLAQNTRLLIYNSSIVKMNLLVYQQP